MVCGCSSTPACNANHAGTILVAADQIIALAASIAACASAIAAFWVILQIRKHRELSYQPVLVIPRIVVTGSSKPGGGLAIPANWYARDISDKKPDSFLRFAVPIINLGLGAAKQVNVTWSLPVEDLFTELSRLVEKANSTAYVHYRNEILEIGVDDEAQMASIWSNERATLLDFVLPAHIDQEPLDLNIPMTYILLISSLVYFAAQTGGFYGNPASATLQADLEYYDIGGRKHKSKFSISVHVSIVEDKGKIFHGYIESSNTV